MADSTQRALRRKIATLKLKNKLVKQLPFNRKWKHGYLFKTHFKLLNYTSQYQRAVFRKIFGLYAKGVVFNTANGDMVGCPEDVEINRRLGFSGQYDFHKMLYLKNLAGNGSVIYFLGPHIGTLLIPLSKGAKKVIGFEANPDTFEFLKYNVALNNIENAEIFNYGVYDSPGTFFFYKNKANSGGSKVKPRNDRFIYNYDQPSESTIETVCLDDFVASNELPLPDLMIVDIEGSEYPAMKVSQKCLANCKYLYIEFVPHHLSDVANIDVDTFLSVIVPFFNKMTIPGFADKIFEGSEIKNTLEYFYSNGICVDLLFGK